MHALKDPPLRRVIREHFFATAENLDFPFAI